MKLCIIAFLAVASIQVRAQSTTDSLYIVTYTAGSSWDASRAPNEQRYFAEHSANLAALRRTGIIKMGARYADKGIIVIAAASGKIAHELIHADQAVTNNLFHAEIQKFNVFYDGCVTKQ